MLTRSETGHQKTAGRIGENFLSLHFHHDVLQRPAIQLESLPGKSSRSGMGLQRGQLLEFGDSAGIDSRFLLTPESGFPSPVSLPFRPHGQVV